MGAVAVHIKDLPWMKMDCKTIKKVKKIGVICLATLEFYLPRIWSSPPIYSNSLAFRSQIACSLTLELRSVTPCQGSPYSPLTSPLTSKFGPFDRYCQIRFLGCGILARLSVRNIKSLD